eukprot:CAMPEP_0205904216 /NCGR_PEP_ID=MMETSP1325-20131115/585_1 /ASSEMBLY_ACC=CAM_ASM_000708 /TAXON_ID=236786 /ORGANISM="Florenciella sp., Strain RCC1007" /LENGTH=245 /DNA_ID=CAMNT_0053269959 /DNA_START=21 /DNA_END=756 /DNA_ORIENTATION=-
MKFLLVLAGALATGSAFLSSSRSVSIAARRAPVNKGIFMRKRAVSPMKGKSKVLLTKDLEGVGRSEEVVTVKNGFYLNYILPRGFGSLATAEALEQAAVVAAKRAEEDAVIAAAAEENKAKLEAIKTFTVTKKVGADEQLFGSVSVTDVLGAVEEASGLTLGSPKVKIEDIKMAGTYDFTIKLHQGITAVLSLTVEPEAESSEEKVALLQCAERPNAPPQNPFPVQRAAAIRWASRATSRVASFL